MKTKRKNSFEDDFSDFSLSSPATKIRRLDAELPPIMEESELVVPLDEEELVSTVSEPPPEIEIEEAPLVPVNEERALVLYKPVHELAAGVSVTINPDVVSGFRNDVFWYGRSDQLRPFHDQPDFEEDRSSNNCLAVVPWVSNQQHNLEVEAAPIVTEVTEPMEAEDMEVGTMEIEDEGGMSVPQGAAGMVNGAVDMLQSWQQQHCMTSHPPPTAAATPIMWSL